MQRWDWDGRDAAAVVGVLIGWLLDCREYGPEIRNFCFERNDLLFEVLNHRPAFSVVTV